MTRSLIFRALTILVAGLWMSASLAVDELSVQAVYVDIERWFPGTYTNIIQLANHDGTGEAFALTTIVRPLNNPALGNALYYLEEFRDNDPEAVTRIRIYSFTTENSGVRLRLLNPIDIDALKGSHTDLSQVEKLTPQDIKLDHYACMLDVTNYDGTLVARMRYRACDVRETWNDYELIIDHAGSWTCYARRLQSDDSLAWLQMPAFPCVRQQRTASASP